MSLTSGQLITSWGGDLEAADLPPTMIVGAHRPDDEALRLHEYSPIPRPLPRAYVVADEQEPFFLENANRWADALRDAGADVVMVERAGAHGGAFWKQELPLMVKWAFRR